MDLKKIELIHSEAQKSIGFFEFLYVPRVGHILNIDGAWHRILTISTGFSKEDSFQNSWAIALEKIEVVEFPYKIDSSVKGVTLLEEVTFKNKGTYWFQRTPSNDEVLNIDDSYYYLTEVFHFLNSDNYETKFTTTYALVKKVA